MQFTTNLFTLGSLSQLQTLKAAGNQFSNIQSIPFGQLLSLIELDLSRNLFSGQFFQVPLSIAILSNFPDHVSLSAHCLQF